MSKQIAIFGGSFNPPHAGHREIVRRVAARKRINEVWVLPVFRHPFRKRLALFEKRLRSCRGFFRGLGPKVRVKDLERRLGGTSWTIRLVRYLKKRYPRHRFLLVLGQDAYRQRGAWRDFREIRRNAGLIVFPRGPRSPIPNISSTRLRCTPP